MAAVPAPASEPVITFLTCFLINKKLLKSTRGTIVSAMSKQNQGFTFGAKSSASVSDMEEDNQSIISISPSDSVSHVGMENLQIADLNPSGTQSQCVFKCCISGCDISKPNG